MFTPRALRRKAFIASTATALALGALGATAGVASAQLIDFDGDSGFGFDVGGSGGSDGVSGGGEANGGGGASGSFGPGRFDSGAGAGGGAGGGFGPGGFNSGAGFGIDTGGSFGFGSS